MDPPARQRSAPRYPEPEAATLTAAAAGSNFDYLNISVSLMNRLVFASRCSFSERAARETFRGAVKPSASIIPALTQARGPGRRNLLLSKNLRLLINPQIWTIPREEQEVLFHQKICFNDRYNKSPRMSRNCRYRPRKNRESSCDVPNAAARAPPRRSPEPPGRFRSIGAYLRPGITGRSKESSS